MIYPYLCAMESILRREIVYSKLKEWGVAYRVYEHPALPTVEVALEYWNTLIAEECTHCKNLFFRNHKGNRHYLVIMECHKTLPIHDLEHVLHQGKLSFASPERMERCLGTTPGSVSLFGLINDPNGDVKLFLDKDLKQAVNISFHPNDNTASLVISQAGFQTIITNWGGEYEYLDFDCIEG